MNNLLIHILYLKTKNPPLIKKDHSTSPQSGNNICKSQFPTVFSQLVSEWIWNTTVYIFIEIPYWMNPTILLLDDGLLKFRGSCWLKLFLNRELHQDPELPHPPPRSSTPPSSLIRVVMPQKSTSVFQGVVQMLPSVQSVEQQENGADADHRAQDERVPSFPQVDSLDEVVDGGEPVSGRSSVREHIWTSDPQTPHTPVRKDTSQGVDSALNGLEHAPLGCHVLLGCHGNA